MAAKTDTDRVIIRQWRENGQAGLIAFLPDNEVNYGKIDSYQHVGQHSEADLGFYWGTRKVDYDLPEVKALADELTTIGYNVRLCQRLNRPFGGWAK